MVQHNQIFILNEQKYNIKPFKLSKKLFDLALWLPWLQIICPSQYCAHNSFFLHLWISKIYIRQYPAIEYCVRNKIIVSYFESVFFRIFRAGYTEPVHCFVKTLKLFKTSVAFLKKSFRDIESVWKWCPRAFCINNRIIRTLSTFTLKILHSK